MINMRTTLVLNDLLGGVKIKKKCVHKYFLQCLLLLIYVIKICYCK